MIASQIQKELNLRVLEWGIEIGEVSLYVFFCCI